MPTLDQHRWITEHIPHRVRAACARLPHLEQSLLRVKAFIDPSELKTEEEQIYWRCATDAIWEGRLAVIRWLIEFVGVKQDNNGNPSEKKKGEKNVNDVLINDFDGGSKLDLSTAEAKFLANVWKGCSQASSHATDGSNHPPVSDQEELPQALTIIVDHLQNTIYGKANKNLRDFVLSLK